MLNVHPTAVIQDGAQIGAGCTIGPFSVIGPNVVLGQKNIIGPHVVIEGHTKVGDENHIFQFSSIGAAPQDLKFHGEPSVLEIGNRNMIREFVTLQPGTEGGGMITRIGSGNLFMANSHVGHDAQIGDSNVFANSAALGGHVVVGSNVIIGGLVGVHQFVRLGDLCFLGAGSMVSKDVPPFCMAQGDRAGLVGLNSVGLKRRGAKSSDLQQLRRIFRELFHGPGHFNDRVKTGLEAHKDFEYGFRFLKFIQESARGVTFPRRGERDEEATAEG